jgi:hypothetical protein
VNFDPLEQFWDEGWMDPYKQKIPPREPTASEIAIRKHLEEERALLARRKDKLRKQISQWGMPKVNWVEVQARFEASRKPNMNAHYSAPLPLP